MQLFVDGAGTDANGDIALIRSLTPLLAADRARHSEAGSDAW